MRMNFSYDLNEFDCICVGFDCRATFYSICGVFVFLCGYVFGGSFGWYYNAKFILRFFFLFQFNNLRLFVTRKKNPQNHIRIKKSSGISPLSPPLLLLVPISKSNNHTNRGREGNFIFFSTNINPNNVWRK